MLCVLVGAEVLVDETAPKGILMVSSFDKSLVGSEGT